MPSFNQVIIMGHCTRDPQTKQVGSSSVTEFGVACNRKFKTAGGEEREEVLFADVAAWGKMGEVIAQYFTKGKPIMVVGRLKLDSWEKDGQKRTKLSIVAEEFQFVGGNKGDAGGNGEQADYTPPARTAAGAHRHPTRQPAPKPEQPFGDEAEFKEADVPF